MSEVKEQAPTLVFGEIVEEKDVSRNRAKTGSTGTVG